METVFDLATPQELVELFGEDFDDADGEYHRQCAIEDADYGLALFASLYSIRGDMARADAYAERIQDVQRRFEVQHSLHECTAGAM